ncbi:MAG: zf-TFIIB domain-containing protein [Planctomycetota bacterium]|nr:zf-TFIIB domain-containing protein [Planctomycetota bacterium]
MRCPACKLALATLEVEGVELDFCVEGHGYWLDEGELEVLLGAEEAVLEVGELGGGNGGKGPGGRRPRCPRCKRSMTPVVLFEGLELDLCPVGDGIWFDEGELAVLMTELVRAGRVVADTPLARSLDSLTRHFGGTS